jgi:DNA-binding transcriptional ArsR family regulator
MSKNREQAATDVFFALSDGTRLSLVRRLGNGSPLSATSLADGAEVTRQAIVKHLRVLEEAGIVSHEKRGREVLYALDPDTLVDAQAFLEAISRSWDGAIDRLRRLVEEPAPRPAESRPNAAESRPNAADGRANARESRPD